MAKHFVEVELGKPIELRRAGITVRVFRNNKAFCRIEIGQGGIKLLRRGKQKRGPDLSWRGLLENLRRKRKR